MAINRVRLNPFHKYLYANDNPIFYVDPSGQEGVAELLTITGIKATLFTIGTNAVSGAVVNVGIGLVMGTISGQGYSWQEARYDAIEGAVVGNIGAGIGKLAGLLTKTVGASFVIKYGIVMGEVFTKAAFNTLATVVKRRVYNHQSTTYGQMRDLLMMNIFFSAIFKGIERSGDAATEIAQDEAKAIRSRLGMEGGDKEAAGRFMNSWAAGQVTNQMLRDRLQNLEELATPLLKTMFGASVITNFIKDLSEAFSTKLDETTILEA